MTVLHDHQEDKNGAMEQLPRRVAPEGLTRGQWLTWERQEAFLAAFAGIGTILKASEAVGISREIVRLSDTDRAFGFAARYKDARQSFR